MASNPANACKPERGIIFLIVFSSFFVLIAAIAISAGYGVHHYWANMLRAEIGRDLTQKARMFATRVESDRSHNTAQITSQVGHDAGARATVIDSNGKVLADSEVPISSLETEVRRPEFAAALHNEVGMDTRRNGRFGTSILYVAVPVSGGAVRLAYPLADVEIAASHSRQILFLLVGIGSVAAIAVSALLARISYR